MTYQELIDLYMRSGGMAPRAPSYSPTGEGGSFAYDPGGSQAVQLPDGRTAMVNADGTITISQLNDGRDRETVTRMTPDGQATTEEREYDRNANFRRSLAGAIGRQAVRRLREAQGQREGLLCLRRCRVRQVAREALPGPLAGPQRAPACWVASGRRSPAIRRWPARH
jgi:hypothetical protein